MSRLAMIAETAAEQTPRGQTVVVLAPSAQDAHVCERVLRDAQLPAVFSATLDDFCSCIGDESGVALIAEEHLNTDALNRLTDTLDNQPTWSDFPLIVLLAGGEHSTLRIEQLLSMGNVTLIQRPLRIAIFVNTLRARLRDRGRQFAVRDIVREQALARQQSAADARRFDMALKAGDMGAWEQNGKQVYWSQKMYDLFGYSSDMPASVDAVYDRVHEDDRDELMQRWKDATSRAEAFQHKFRIRHPSRSVRWVETVGEPVRSRTGTSVCYAGLTWDITEEREANEKIEHARRQAELLDLAKSEFLANMSH
ncbi:MAG: PAS domain-containing protein [Planctomycetaceae bacterium]